MATASAGESRGTRAVTQAGQRAAQRLPTVNPRNPVPTRLVRPRAIRVVAGSAGSDMTEFAFTGGAKFMRGQIW